jgi:CBS domain-containing protein/ribosome-associated translation inhibitor RaiA
LATSLRELAFSEIRELVHASVSVFAPDEPVSRVLGVLKETDRYEAAVKSDGSVGLITVRDMLDIDQPSSTKVDSVWRATGSVRESDTVIDIAENLVRNNIRALPVVEGGNVVGIISQIDLTLAMCDVPDLSCVAAKELIRSPVLSLDINEKVAFARRLMLDKGISHVPVIEYGRLVGVVTAKDIVNTFIVPASRTTSGDRIEVKVPRFPGIVAGVLDTHPLSVGAGATALDVACGLRDRGKGACFMTDEVGRIVGIITPSELLPLLLRFRVREELPVYIIGLSDEDFFERAVAEEKVRRVVRRGMRFRPDLTEVSVRIKSTRTRGNRTRYELTARALSPEGQINAEADGWDLLRAFDELCDTLGKAIRRSKPETPRQPRRRRSRR